MYHLALVQGNLDFETLYRTPVPGTEHGKHRPVRSETCEYRFVETAKERNDIRQRKYVFKRPAGGLPTPNVEGYRYHLSCNADESVYIMTVVDTKAVGKTPPPNYYKRR